MFESLFAPDIEDALDEKQLSLTAQLLKGIEQLRSLKGERTFFNPDPPNNRELYNNQIDLAWCSNNEKLLQIFDGLTYALRNKNYIVYGLLSRSLLEHTATAWYFVNIILKPTFENILLTGKIKRSDFEVLMQGVHRYLKGSRFSWDAFEERDFQKLREKMHETELKPFAVLTCLDKWVKEFPTVYYLYNLLCDLVHPNVGSTMLVEKYFPSTKQIAFGGNEGIDVGIALIRSTWVAVIMLIKQFQDLQNLLNGYRMGEAVQIE